jgi:hypothetical protein
MADELITVEWIGTAQALLATIQKIDTKIERQEKMMQKLTDTSKKGADAAAGSFNKLEAELKQNEAALKDLQIGSKAFTDQKKKVDELRGAFNGTKNAISTNKSALGSLASSAIGSMAGLAAGMAGFKMLLEATIAEFEKASEVRLKASATMQSVEGAIADMAINIGADKVGAARGMIEENAPKLGVTQEGLASLLAAGISGGAEDLDESLKLSAAALKLTAGDAQKAMPIMSGTLTVAATTGNRDFESVLGQLSQFQEAARGEDLATSIANMSTAMAAANTKGERIDALGSERTLEMSAVISQLLQDKDMSVTGTTMRQMFSKMDSFIPKTEATLDDGTKSKLAKKDVEDFNKLGTMDERMGAMRANPELAKQFLSTIEENQGKSAVRQLVKGDENAIALEKTAAGIVTGEVDAKKDFTALTDVIGDNTKNLAAANQSKAADQVTDPKLALEGSIIETFNRAVDGMENASGLDSMTRADAKNHMTARMAMGDDAATAALTTLEELKNRETVFGFIPAGGAVSENDTAKLDAQMEIIRGLSESVKSVEDKKIEGNARAMAKGADANKDGQIQGEEAGAMLTDLQNKGKLTPEMQAAVQGADKDKSGTASIDELTKAMASNDGFRELLMEMRAVKDAIVAQVPGGKQQPPQKQRPQLAPLAGATAP